MITLRNTGLVYPHACKLANPIQATALHDICLTAVLMKIDDLQCVTIRRPASSHRRFGTAKYLDLHTSLVQEFFGCEFFLRCI
jgi:hypothetical protein